MPAPNEITVPQLARLIGTPDCPTLIDICTPEDHAEDPFLIPGAMRHSHQDLQGLEDRIEGPAVVICQKGRKLSQGFAAYLNAVGIRAEYLQGGMIGWREAHPVPRVPADSVPAPVGETTLWVTRQRPKIDRIACPWLVRRFIDPNARFLFVSPSEVTNVAERLGATPFDVENVFWSHRGDACSFDTMLDVWNLRTEALDRLSTVIRAADTNRHELHPAAAGLLAFSVGLSRQYRDDQAQLAAGLPLYDALYRWARDGHEEGHDWPTVRGQ